MNQLRLRQLACCILLLTSSNTWAQDWQPLTGAESIEALFSDTIMRATLRDNVEAVATYNSDGSGELKAWGDTFPRRWQLKGDDQVCLEIDEQTRCFSIEKDAADTDQYRASNVSSGESVVFSVSEREIVVSHDPSSDSAAGGASEPSAAEIAQKLANPNAPMASLTFRLQQRSFNGDLPGASKQSGTALMFQPSFPFTLENGDVVFFRPNIPLQFSAPAIDPISGDFESESGLGDIVFDVAYGRTTKTGMLYAGGMVVSLPTATEDALGTDRFSMGPEFMIGKLSKKYVLGMFPSHLWDVGGSGDNDVNITNAQLFGTYLPGNAWNFGSSPILSYDHNSDQWTVPLNFTFGKTVIWNSRPWKLSAEINYYVEQADSFGPQWFIGINVAPVVENVMANWFK
jgi:hypothetical protein